MFYSHQLLARKAPLGQIWMAATMHAKIHRRKLDKLNIIRICEEILNPSVPMALRLSGILMGGVVIVYERKVKLLYDDFTRLLAEVNEAWKVKSAPSDPTRLPKGKTQAKNKSVTLPPNHNEDLGEMEEMLPCSNSTTQMDFQQTSYFAMRLDNLDDHYLDQNLGHDQEQNHHQADAADITLVNKYDPCQADTTTFNHFERFDVEWDEETQLNFTVPEHTEMPGIIPSHVEWDEETQLNFTEPKHTEMPGIISSPPRQEELTKSDEVHHEEQFKQQSAESKEANSDQKRQRIARRRARKHAIVMDYDQTIITGHTYQSWLQDTSDLIRERITKKPRDPLPFMKTGAIMELPSVILVEKLFTDGFKFHYPAPLLEDWVRSIQPPHDSPSGGASHPQPPEPSSLSPPERMHFTEPAGDPFEDFRSRFGSPSTRISIEKQRENGPNDEMPPKIITDELMKNLKSNGVSASKVNLMTTPAHSGDELRSIHSSGSGHDFFSHNSDTNSGRSSKKRPFSASKLSGNCLEPVAEDISWEHPDANVKFAKLSIDEFAPDNDLLVETGPTQTQKPPVTNHPLDQITDSIREHLKNHFDTPGVLKVESLDQLALGMNKKRAASLFYQTCVLATRDYIKLDQKVPYGDIQISRGPKM